MGLKQNNICSGNKTFAVKRMCQLYAGLEGTLYRYRHYVLIISFLIVLIPFLIARLPFFLYYPVPFVQPDTGEYWAIVSLMDKGHLPSFSYRTPGYPLFMHLVYTLVAPKLMALITAQNIFSLASILFMVYCVYRVRMLFILSPLVALALGIFTFRGLQLASDFAPLTESLYTSCIIIALAFLIRGLYEKHSYAFFLSSFFMVLSIMVRPTGQFFIVTYIMIMIFLFVNRYFYQWRRIIAFAIPFPLLLLFWLTYNYFTIGSFKMSNGFDVTLICGTSLYLSESPEFSEELNEIIRKISSRVSPDDRAILCEASWNLKKIAVIYYKCEYWNIESIIRPFNNEKIPEFKKLGLMGIYRKVAMHSIKENWRIFLKVYAMNICLYFFKKNTFYIYDQLPLFYDNICIKRVYRKCFQEESQVKGFLREYYQPPALPYFKVVKTDNASGYTVEILMPFLSRLYHSLATDTKWFGACAWPCAAILICLISGLMTLITKFRNPNAFFLFILTSALIGHCLICSIFAYNARFSAPTVFIYYLSVALFPMIFFRNPLRSQNVQ